MLTIIQPYGSMIFLALVFMLNYPTTVFGQEVRQNENGEMIVVNPDGTWYPLQGSRNTSNSKDPFAEENRSGGPEMMPILNKEEQYLKDVAQQRMELITLGDRLYQQHDQLTIEFNRVKQIRLDLTDRYKQLKKMKSEDLDPIGEGLLMDEIEKARADEEYAKERMARTKEMADLVDEVLQMSDKKMLNSIPDLNKDLLAWRYFLEQERKPAYTQATEVIPPSAPRKNETPPVLSPDCEFSFEGVDEFTGKSRKDLVPRTFFSHTRDELKPYFKDHDYITCNGYMTKMSGNLTFLTLEFVIASQDARYAFGGLDKGSILSIRLLNEEYVRLINTKSDGGVVDPLTNFTTYRAQYQLSEYQMRSLEESEVDQVRVVWRTGYEDYEVFELDFFINQFECLK